MEYKTKKFKKFECAVITATAIMTAVLAFGLTTAVKASEISYGDINGDAVVNIKDATIIQKSAAEIITLSDSEKLTADVNLDTQINSNDAIIIQKVVAGILDKAVLGTSTEEATEPTEEAPTDAPTVDEDAWKENTGTIIFGDTITVTGSGISVVDGVVTISEGGDFTVTGASNDALIYVYTGDEKEENDRVKLRLSGVNLSNDDGPVIYFDKCKKAYITIEEDTVNYIEDSAVYADAYADAKGAIQSDDSLEIKGKGTLNVTGNLKHGLSSSDDIEIGNGVINITSVTDGIHVNDDVVFSKGTVTITSGGDGIQSEAELNFTGGTLNINAGDDGLVAETALNIDGGTYNITSGGGSNATVAEDASAKGIKSADALTINGGTFTINSADDSLHTNNTIIINGGTFDITSGDDGIHSDTQLDISDGEFVINKSYEGIESQIINITGGNIELVSTDDGLNAAGGNDSSSVNGRPGQNQFGPDATTGNGQINISGGYIYINAAGDGVDANGSITMSDGVLIVCGPTDNGNGALDYDSTFTVTGGFVAAAGPSGMAQAHSTSSSVYGALITLSSNQSANSIVRVEDASGNEIVTFAPEKSYNSLLIISESIKASTSYTVKVGGTYSGGICTNGIYSGGTYFGGTTSTTYTQNSVVTTVGRGGMFF